MTCTVSDADDAPGTVSASFTVTVLGASSQTSSLISLVQSYNLAPAFANSLISKLQGVQNDLATGATTDACNQLSSFINQVRAQSGKKLTTSQANTLIAAARQIEAVIGC